MVDNMMATGSHIVPRFQEPSNEKLSTIKDKMHTIKDHTNIKTRPSIKLNKVGPSIKWNKVQARAYVCAEPRDDIHGYTRVDVSADTRDDAHAYNRVHERAHIRNNVHDYTRVYV